MKKLIKIQVFLIIKTTHFGFHDCLLEIPNLLGTQHTFDTSFRGQVLHKINYSNFNLFILAKEATKVKIDVKYLPFTLRDCKRLSRSFVLAKETWINDTEKALIHLKQLWWLLINGLTFPVLIPDNERKLTKIFIFTLLCGATKGFMKAFKSFIKPFGAPQSSVKIKI